MSKILIGLDEITEHFQPLYNRLNMLEENLLNQQVLNDKVFSDKDASVFLKMSTKKLQTLRNKREITFIREPLGRKISYKLSHLLDYLKKNEIKAKK